MSLRVLFVDTATYLGGAEMSLLALMRQLEGDKYVPCLLTSGNGPLAESARETGIPVETRAFPWLSRRRPWRYVNSILQLSWLIRARRIDLVHTNCDHSLPYVNRACGLSRVPYVSHVRDSVRTWLQPDKVAILNRAAYVIANSDAMADALCQAGVGESQIRVIYNPVEIDRFEQEPATSREAVRAQLSLPQDAFVVGIVGQIQALKGHTELAMAAPQILSKVENSHFVVAGEAFGPESVVYESSLRRLIDESGLTERFRFIGFRDDVPAVMQSLDVLAVPSWMESFGRVVVEGMAAGRPVVGTRVGGIPEIITDEVDGLLVPPRDVQSLAAAIVRLAQDEALRERLSTAGLAAAQRFDAPHHVAEVQALYESVLVIERGA